MSSTSVAAVIGCLAELFSLEGIPLDIFMGSGQPFNSKEWYTLVLFWPVLSLVQWLHSRHVYPMKSALSKAKASKSSCASNIDETATDAHWP